MPVALFLWRAEALWRRLGSLRPAVRKLVAQANDLRDRGNPQEAATLYQRAIEAGDDRPGVRKQLANMLKDSRRFNEAFEQYSLCLATKRNLADTYVQLGHLFKMQGEMNRAIEYYRKAADSPDGA